jgi:hypothetical protein
MTLLLGTYPKACKSGYNRDTCDTNVHWNTIHNTQAMETTQMPCNWWMDQKMSYIYRMKFYSAITNNDIWLKNYWMQLEDIMLSEANQA